MLGHLLLAGGGGEGVGEELGFFDEGGPVFGDGEVLVEGGCALGGGDADGDGELGFGTAAEDAVGGGDVGVVASDGGTDVAVSGDEVVGGIEADPAEFGHEDLNPGVGGGGGGAVGLLLAAVGEITGDVAAGEVEPGPDEGGHDVGKVLTDALAVLEGDVDGGVDLGGAGDVVEVFVEAGVELVEEAQGVVSAAEVESDGEVVEEGRGVGELAGGEELIEVALGGDLVEVGPGRGGERGGDDGGGLDLDEGFGDDDELGVLAGDVEVVDVVGEVVSVGEDAAAGADGEMEGEAALVGVRARVHASLHHGFGDGLGVEELGKVADGVEDGGLRV